MKEKYKKDILEKLAKKGMPTEIKASRILQQREYLVVHGQPFIDQETEKLRSVDIVADRVEYLPNGMGYKTSGNKSVRLYIECKMSRKTALVFYCGDLWDSINKEFQYFDVSENSSVLEFLSSTLNDESKVGISHEAVNGDDFFFTAQMQVLKSIKYHEKFIDHRTTAIFPIIVLEGRMFECVIDDEDNTDLVEASHITYMSNGLSFDSTPTYIEVTTLEGLPRLLEKIEEIYKTLPRENRYPSPFRVED